nr:MULTISPECIES: helix-turn-helix transcriptional regulator [unclassified Butyricicoccus]
MLRFRAFRMKCRISLAELSQASGVSMQRISQIELMDCPVTPHLIELLTRALEIVLLRRSAMAAVHIADYREQQEHLFDAISETEVITDGS